MQINAILSHALYTVQEHFRYDSFYVGCIGVCCLLFIAFVYI